MFRRFMVRFATHLEVVARGPRIILYESFVDRVELGEGWSGVVRATTTVIPRSIALELDF